MHADRPPLARLLGRADVSRRSRQAHALAAILSTDVGQLIAVTWEGPRHRAGRRGGWRVAWHDGPDEATMRTLVVTRATVEAPDLDPAALGYDHHRSDLGTAVALLMWLAAHPDSGDRLREVLHADRLPGASERAPARTHALAETLLAAGWTPAGHDHGRVGTRLNEVAAMAGWDGVAGWLEGLATSHDTTEFRPVVVDLDAHRARHGRRGGRLADSQAGD